MEKRNKVVEITMKKKDEGFIVVRKS